MKDKILNTAIAIVLVLLVADFLHPKFDETDRYKIITADNMLTILLDKKTGETWRNSICSKESQVPGCWERMHFVDQADFYLPEGEKKVRKQEQKLIKKLQKVQAKLQKAQDSTDLKNEENAEK